MTTLNEALAAPDRHRRGRRLRLNHDPRASGPDSVAKAVFDYLQWSLVTNYSKSTIAGRAFYLGRFSTWSEERGVLRPNQVNGAMLEEYQAQLFTRPTRTGNPMSVRSQYLHLHAARMFFRWAVRHGWTSDDPTQDLRLPRLGQRLPRDVFTHAESEAVMRQPNLLDPLGLRDRAILEVLYSTAIRRTELTQLTVWDLDRALGTVLIRQGKGGKDRVVPIGDRAVTWVDRHLTFVRPILVHAVSEPRLFLTKRGDPLLPSQLSASVAAYITVAGIGKHGSCHLFRHTCATLMLEGGADIRFIQEMLGHASLASTQIYTRVSIRKLKEVHTATHPAADVDHDPPSVFAGVAVDDHHVAGDSSRLQPGWKRPYLVAVGRHLKELREQRGLSRDAVARRAGSTRGHIRKLEEGVHPPRPAMVEKLARALAVDPSDLVPSQPSSALVGSKVRGPLS